MDKKIEVPRTKYHRIVNFLCQLLLAGIFVWLFIMWRQIPDQIPKHYNGVGEIDSWGSKYTLLFCPIVAVFMYLGIGLLEKYPEIWNTGVEITKKNKVQIYSVIKNMIVTLKFVMVFIFTYITYNDTLVRPLPGWFTPGSLLLTFGPMVFFLIQIYRKR